MNGSGKLPGSYVYFLKQYHFIDLQLGGSIRFFDNKPGELLQELKKKMHQFYEGFLERGLLPFASYFD